MSVVTIVTPNGGQFGSPYGNLSIFPFALATKADGSPLNSQYGSPLQNGDQVVLGGIEAGMRLDDAIVNVSAKFSDSVTGTLGFQYADGEDDANVPQDASYFGSFNLAAPAKLRPSVGKKPLTLAKDANLVLAIGGANNAVAGIVDIAIIGELKGAA